MKVSESKQRKERKEGKTDALAAGRLGCRVVIGKLHVTDFHWGGAPYRIRYVVSSPQYFTSTAIDFIEEFRWLPKVTVLHRGTPSVSHSETALDNF